MKPTDLKCRPQVAAVIGEAYADHELQRVMNWHKCKVNIGAEDIDDAFVWECSPQGNEFWRRINCGENPYEQGHERSELKEWIYHEGEWLCRDNDYYTDDHGCCTMHISEVSGVPVHTGAEKPSYVPESAPGDNIGACLNKNPALDFSMIVNVPEPETRDKERSDGSTASYYELPEVATELQHLISHRNMNAQIGEIFRACYRYGLVSHSDMLRDAKKIKFYAQAEIERLEKLAQSDK